ncbi:hypothetical protein P8452_32607 [Trifolium repens]|nr:hypothetical protein P8452_32607 [Trifolium repens]
MVSSQSLPQRLRTPVSFKWDVRVTRSIASGKNVMNFSRDYVRNCLRKSDRYVYLLDYATGKVFRPPILSSSRHVEDKFIYYGWKRFVIKNNLHVRDRLMFNSPNGDNFLEVKVGRFSRFS